MDEENSSVREVKHSEDDSTVITNAGCAFKARNRPIRVAVIGGGTSGLCAARHLFAENSGFTGVVYELGSDAGGTWVYTEEVGNGTQRYSALYYDLKANVPKEVMAFPDFKYPPNERSYLPAEDIRNYLDSYAKHFNVYQHIKLNHQVIHVAPVGKNWSVTALNLITKIEEVGMFDAVMICTGAYATPLYPVINGIARFSGQQLHARAFRKAETFAGKRVLVIGLGPSGVEIAHLLIKHAKQVILSHRKPELKMLTLDPAIIVKNQVTSLDDKTVFFADKTTMDVDVIIYCTGYTYNFPYLSKDCGLIVNQFVSPLYRHFINIEIPTMCIVGIPSNTPHQFCIDYQVRTFLKILKGEVKLPPKEEMLKELDEDITQRRGEGQRYKEFHKMRPVLQRNREYFRQLSSLGQLPPLPDVYLQLFSESFLRAITDFQNFRNYSYTVSEDEETFEVKILEPVEPPKEEPAPPQTTVTQAIIETNEENNNANSQTLEEITETIAEVTEKFHETVTTRRIITETVMVGENDTFELVEVKSSQEEVVETLEGETTSKTNQSEAFTQFVTNEIADCHKKDVE